VSAQAPVYAIWRNPLFVKGRRQRLRWRSLATWALVVLTITSFIFLITFFPTFTRMRETELAARMTVIPLLVVQGVLLMLMGTGAIASGIASERDSGVFDYQRLTPMSPARKILGYLFGLPAREWLLFAMTLPFTLFSIVAGNISLVSMANIYLIFISSVLLYHLTGMTAGMVSSKPRLAAMLSQGMVLTLYLLLPLLSNLGFTLFEYLTVRPVVKSMLGEMLIEMGQRSAGWLIQYGGVRFFTFELHPTVYSLMMQGLCIVAFLTAVHRRWRRHDANIFGRRFALGFVIGLQVVLIGTLWPQFTGERFSAELMREIAEEFGMAGTALLSVYVWAMLAAITAALLVHLTTPTVHGYRRGLRRAWKLGRSRLPLTHDNAPTLPMASGLAAVLVVGYLLTMQPVFGLDEVFQQGPGLARASVIPLMLVGMTIYLAAVRLRFGPRGLFLTIFILWVIPLMAFAVMTATRDALRVPGYYIAAPSPAAQLAYGVLYLFDFRSPVTSVDLSRFPGLSWFAALFNAGLAAVMVWEWRRWKRLTHAQEHARRTS